jgi:hypothetical protein
VLAFSNERCPERRPYGSNVSVQAQLAHRHEPVKVDCVIARGGKNGQRNRQIISSPNLRQIGRRQVDNNVPARKVVAGFPYCRTHPLPGFADGSVGKPNDLETARTGGYDGFDLDRPGFHTYQGT